MSARPGITPFLWFATKAEEAAAFYVGLCPGSRIDRVTRYRAAALGIPAAFGIPAGSVATVAVTLGTRAFAALNGGSTMDRNGSVSLACECDDQAEIDRVWDALLDGGGQAERCGRLKDRHGFSRQIVPTAMRRSMGDGGQVRAARIMHAMMGMVTLDIAALEAAHRS